MRGPPIVGSGQRVARPAVRRRRSGKASVMAGADDARLVRRLRLALVGVSILCGLCVLAVIAVLVYWRLYLLGPTSGPFARGPFLTRLDGTSARLKWTLNDGSKTVE